MSRLDLVSSALGFFTQHELDSVVGYGRQRQRLVKRGVLPAGARVRAFGKQTIIFPEFVAAGLVVQRPTAQDERLLGYVRAASARVYETESFSAIAEAIRAALQVRATWELSDLAAALVEHARDALQVWRLELEQAERDLAEAGITLNIQLGRIEQTSDAGYLVSLRDGERISVGINATSQQLAPGTWVTRDLVKLGARRGELLLPTVAPELLADIRENPAAPASEAQESEEMFGPLNFQPVVVPVLHKRSEQSDDAGGDLVRPVRRLKVRANRAIYATAEANTMARHRDRPLTAR